MAQRYRFGIEEFERLFQGVTGVELLDGEVYQMSPIGPKHAEVVACLVNVLSANPLLCQHGSPSSDPADP